MSDGRLLANMHTKTIIMTSPVPSTIGKAYSNIQYFGSWCRLSPLNIYNELINTAKIIIIWVKILRPMDELESIVLRTKR